MAIELSAAGNFLRPRASSQASKAISGRCRHWPVDWESRGKPSKKSLFSPRPPAAATTGMSAHRRLHTVASALHAAPSPAADSASYKDALVKCKAALVTFISKMKANPIMVRLAWHDSGTYDSAIAEWPACGGANGSIRFEPEINHGANAGLSKAVNYLKRFKKDFPELSWADIIQMASATAIEVAGGPKIPMRYGRVDVTTPDQCPPEGNLPGAAGPFDDAAGSNPFPSAQDPQTHLRNIFHRMGFNDREIVALSGAHTIGRAFAERSGTVAEGYGPKKGTEHTSKPGMGMAGGRSWTKNWLTFDNSYFTDMKAVSYQDDGGETLTLPTDFSLTEDAAFKVHFDEFKDQAKFFEAYAAVHAKLSELGSKFEPAGGIKID
jgi:L-ascorbate peroxidase